MAFFLIGRVDDTLTLLSPNTFASRQDAMGALSRITAEPGFALWDAEVILLDADSGTPVLLMRPAVEPEATAVEPEASAVEPEVDADEDVVLVAVEDIEPLESVVVEEPLDELAEPQFATDVDDIDLDEPAPVSLKEALTRTAVQMEADGIVAPESIAAPEQVESAPDSGWPWDTAADSGEALESLETPLVDASEFVLSPLEEPSLDDRSILHATIDDEMFAAARPVIMGAYPGQIGEDEPESDTLESLIDDLVVEPMGIAPLAAPSPKGFAVPVIADAGDFFPVESTTTPEDVDGDTSDFILDLVPDPNTEALAEAPGELDGYTCGDCVYEETCPNKDQRLPKDCGSFQWR